MAKFLKSIIVKVGLERRDSGKAKQLHFPLIGLPDWRTGGKDPQAW
jgi:hypothetical protein